MRNTRNMDREELENIAVIMKILIIMALFVFMGMVMFALTIEEHYERAATVVDVEGTVLTVADPMNEEYTVSVYDPESYNIGDYVTLVMVGGEVEESIKDDEVVDVYKVQNTLEEQLKRQLPNH